MGRVTITVLKWEKYNPRNDFKTPIWFALSNRVLEDPDLWDLDPLEFKAFIYILCQASQRKSSTVELRFAHAERISNIDKKVLLRTIEKLEQIHIVQTVESLCTEGHDTSVRHTTLQDITRHNKQDNTEPAAQFDFEKAFKLYPLRIKGADAERRFKLQVKTEQDEIELHQATKNYVSMLAVETWRKPKQTFATFLGTKSSGYFWRDFITWAPQISGCETKEERIARMIKEKGA